MADSYQVLAICMLLVAISCVSRARDCIPVHGYESCACYFPAVNDTREYVNLLPLKTNSSSPRYVLCSLCKVGIHFSLLKRFRKPCLRKLSKKLRNLWQLTQIRLLCQEAQFLTSLPKIFAASFLDLILLIEALSGESFLN